MAVASAAGSFAETMRNKSRLIVAAALAVVVAVLCWWMLRPAAAPVVDPTPTDAPATTNVESPRESAPRRQRTAATEEAAPAEAADEAETPARHVKLVVHVAAKGGGATIEGARVEFGEPYSDAAHVVSTDSSGVARGELTTRGDWVRLLVTAPGFVREGWFDAAIDAAGAAEARAFLRTAVNVKGVVVDSRTGAPLEGARVGAEEIHEAVCSYGGPSLARLVDGLVVGADGAFKIGCPPDTGAWLYFDAPGHASGEATWSPGDDTTLLIRLDPAGAVRGVVRDPAGLPVADISVDARKVDDKSHGESTKTDSQGRFELQGIALDRTYEAWAVDDSRASAPARGVLVSTQAPNADIELRLLKPAELVVRLRGPDGDPIVGETVTLHLATFDNYGKSSESGDATFVVAQAGPCRVEIDSDRFLPCEVAFEIAPGAHRTQDVALDAGLAVEGVVVDDLDDPVEGAQVRSTQPRGPSGERTRSCRTSSGTGGAFRLTGLTTTPCEIAASADEHEDAHLEDVVAPKEGLRFVLRRQGTVVLTVRVPDGAPRPEEVVLSFDLKTSEQGSTTTNVSKSLDDGDQIVASVAAGRCSFFVTAAGYAPTKRAFEVKPGERIDLGVIELGRGLVATGRVVDAEGHGVAGASVTAIMVGGDIDPSATTDAAGAFRLERFPVGGAYVVATAVGFLDSDLTKYDASDGAAPLVLTLSRGGRLRGRVVDPEHRIAAKDVCVGVTGPIVGEFEGRREFVDVDEKFAFSKQLAAGRWRVVIIGDDHAELATKEIDVKDGEETSIDLVVVR